MLPYLIAGAIGYGIAKLFEEDKTPKYADGGLIAPNGKPSNLTPEQYELVRTPAFKDWFGDWEKVETCQPYTYSKLEGKQNNMLLDENGEPQVLYHGSFDYGFTIVDVHGSSEQSLFWLSTSKEFARNFTGYKRFGYKDAKEYYDKEEFLTGIYSFFVKTNKIFDIFNYNQVEEVSQKLVKLLEKEYIHKTKYTRIYKSEDWYKVRNTEISKGNYSWNEDWIGNWSDKDWNEVESWEGDMWIIGMLKELGYDCITNKEGGVLNIGFIGNPNQIKLADEMKDELGKVNEKTNTTFDSNNTDIRFDEGGIIISNELSQDSYDFGNVGNAIIQNGIEVGQIHYDRNKNNSVSIHLLETLKKGIGEKVINYFFANGVNIIYGDAVDSFNFWKKMGAKFDEFNEDINGYPFTISKEDFMQTKYFKNTDIRFDGGGNTQPKDLTTIKNFKNIQKGVDYYSYSEDSKKQEKSDRWYELFIKNQKEQQITAEEYEEFISLSNQLSWEDLD
jgi:hypothetical protein